MTSITNLGRVHGRAVAILLLHTLFMGSWSLQGSTCSFNIIAGEGNITTSTCSRRNSCTSQCRWNISSTIPGNVITLNFFEDPDQGETPVEITFEDGCGEVPLREGFYYGTGYLLSYPVRPNVTMKMQSKSRCLIVTMDVRGVEDPRGIVVNYKEEKPLDDVFIRVENGHVITAHDHLGLDILKSDHVLYRDYETNITAVALHPWDKMLYIADDGTNTIRRYEVEAFDRPITYVADNVTQALGEVTSLAVDPSCGTIYWTDGILNTISSVNPDGTSRRDVITTDLQYPDNLVLDHLQQTLYWTCDGNVFTVESAFTDGSNRRKVVTEYSGPILIALEFQPTGSQVHWMNTVTGKHGTIIGERSLRPFFSEDFENATSFSVSDKYWYWTKAGEPYLYITKADEDWYTSLGPFYNMNIMLHYQTPEFGATASPCITSTIVSTTHKKTLPRVVTDAYSTVHGPSFSFDQKQKSDDDNLFLIPVILSVLALFSVSTGLVYLLICKRSFHPVVNSSGLPSLKRIGRKRRVRDEENNQGEQNPAKAEENGTSTSVPPRSPTDDPH